jgi:hypothetical protein
LYYHLIFTLPSQPWTVNVDTLVSCFLFVTFFRLVLSLSLYHISNINTERRFGEQSKTGLNGNIYELTQFGFGERKQQRFEMTQVTTVGPSPSSPQEFESLFEANDDESHDDDDDDDESDLDAYEDLDDFSLQSPSPLGNAN